MIRIDVADTEVRRALDDLARRAADPAPALMAIGEELYTITRRAFGASADPWGRPWKPTKRGNKPLIGAGRFLSGPSLSYHLEGDSVVMGSSAVYAAIHQFGGQAGRGRKVTIPARPFLPVDRAGGLAPAARDAVIDIVREYLAGE